MGSLGVLLSCHAFAPACPCCQDHIQKCGALCAMDRSPHRNGNCVRKDWPIQGLLPHYKPLLKGRRLIPLSARGLGQRQLKKEKKGLSAHTDSQPTTHWAGA